MATQTTKFRSDDYVFVGKYVDYELNNDFEMNKLKKIISVIDTDSVDYEVTHTSGFGELIRYDGNNLNHGSTRRGFKKILTPEEYNLTHDIGFKDYKNNRTRELKKTGEYLGQSCNMTTYLHILRALSGAFDGTSIIGDGKAWAATDHPVASKSSDNRQYIADPEAGTFSNLFNYKLSVQAIDKLKPIARRFVAPNGLPYKGQYNCVLVSPEDEPIAKRLFGSENELMPMKDPESAENAASSVYGMKYMVIGDGAEGFKRGQWALCDTKKLMQSFYLIYNTRPRIDSSELSENVYIKRFFAYMDFVVGASEARPILFCNSN